MLKNDKKLVAVIMGLSVSLVSIISIGSSIYSTIKIDKALKHMDNRPEMGMNAPMHERRCLPQEEMRDDLIHNRKEPDMRDHKDRKGNFDEQKQMSERKCPPKDDIKDKNNLKHERENPERREHRKENAQEQ